MLKAIVDSIDDLPEPIKTLYQPVTDEGELQGKFRVQIEPVQGYVLDNLDGLKNTMTEIKSENAKMKSAIEGFKGLDAKKVREDLERFEELKKIDPKTEAGRLAETKIKAETDNLKTLHNQELESRDGRNVFLQREIERLLIENQARAAIINAKGEPALLQDTVMKRMKVVETDGKFSVQVVNEQGVQDFVIKDGKPVNSTVDDLVNKLKANPTYGRAFDSEIKPGMGSQRPGSGSGIGGTGGPNPWMKTTFNLTKQMEIIKTNPSMAQALEAQAAAAGQSAF